MPGNGNLRRCSVPRGALRGTRADPFLGARRRARARRPAARCSSFLLVVVLIGVLVAWILERCDAGGATRGSCRSSELAIVPHHRRGARVLVCRVAGEIVAGDCGTELLGYCWRRRPRFGVADLLVVLVERLPRAKSVRITLRHLAQSRCGVDLISNLRQEAHRCLRLSSARPPGT